MSSVDGYHQSSDSSLRLVQPNVRGSVGEYLSIGTLGLSFPTDGFRDRQLPGWAHRKSTAHTYILINDDKTVHSKEPAATQTRTPANRMPVELFLAILDQIDNVDYMATLRQLALVNRSFNSLVIPRLWRVYRISDSGGAIASDQAGGAARWRRVIKDLCTMLASNSRRASFVESLSILLCGSRFRWSLYGASVMRDLRSALLSVPSLKSLTVHVTHKDPQLVIPKLAPIINETSFPFHLFEFECSASLEPAIYPFLRSHQTIKRYSLATDAGYMWYEGRQPQVSRTLAYADILPSLKHYKGPPAYARAISRGRHLESLEVYSNHTSYDLERAEMHTLRTLVNTIAQVDTFILTIDHQRHNPRELGARLSMLISLGYGISLASIVHLRVVRIPGWFRTPVFDAFPPSILDGFTRLESLEWTWSPPPTGESIFNRGWTRAFVSDCHSSCPTLKRIALVNGVRRVTEFVCVMHPAERIAVADYVEEKPTFTQGWNGVYAHATIVLPDGSLWTVWTDFSSRHAYDLYRDAEWTPREGSHTVTIGLPNAAINGDAPIGTNWRLNDELPSSGQSQQDCTSLHQSLNR